MSQNNSNTCYHCGDECIDDDILKDEHHFCCHGCVTVYEIIGGLDLNNYYSIKESGKGVNKSITKSYEFLDDPGFQSKIILFENEEFKRVKLYIPSIHCAACIWLLESLYKLKDGVVRSNANFVKKEVTIDYNPDAISLSQLCEFLSLLGYPPVFDAGNEGKPKKFKNNGLVYRIGIAGFCFGNIMMLYFPEYLGLDSMSNKYAHFFAYLSWALILPIVTYCSTLFYKSAFTELKFKRLDLDVPIIIGISILFARSTFEIFTQTGPGYLDSLAGFVCFCTS